MIHLIQVGMVLIWNFIDRIGIHDYDTIQEVINKWLNNILKDKKYVCYKSKNKATFTGKL